MLRLLIVFALRATVAAFAVGQVTGTAQASIVTYDLTLTATAGGMFNGTGSFSVDGPISSTGLDVFTLGSGGLDSLVFSIAGNSFNLSQAVNNLTSVTFTNGQLTGINYTGTLGSFQFALAAGYLNYSYIDFITAANSTSGTVAAVSAVPLPAALPLFATGLAAMGLLGWRRKRKKAGAAFAAA
jgi:hypothetical protein